jgi:hypothetical protein
MITLRDIIGNIKKGQAALNVRAILNDLDRSYQIFRPKMIIIGADKHGSNASTIFVTIPSQSSTTKKYTIAIWAETQTKMSLDTSLKVYSNSPSFLFNFSYVFHKKGSLLFPEKVPEEFRTMPPKVRNPFGTTGFDKFVYSSIRFIADNKIPIILTHFESKSAPVVPQVRFVKDRSTGKTNLVG